MVAFAFGDCFLSTHSLPSAGGSSFDSYFAFIKSYRDNTSVTFLSVCKNELLCKGIIITRHTAKNIHLFANDVFKPKQQLFSIGFHIAACNKKSRGGKFFFSFFSHVLCYFTIIFFRIFFKQDGKICRVYIHQ